MAQRLLQEIRMSRPFSSPAEEAFLNLWRSANHLQQGLIEVLRRADLTPTQYNVLRILRGSSPEALTCGQVGERMVTREPDVTRLLDRLEKRGLIERTRDQRDRRVVTIRITPAGLESLAGLDQPVADFHVAQLRHMERGEVEALIDLLEKARTG